MKVQKELAICGDTLIRIKNNSYLIIFFYNLYFNVILI